MINWLPSNWRFVTKSSFRFGNKCPILILYYSLSFCLFRQFNNMLQFFEHFERECYVPQGDKTLFEGELLVFSKTNYSIFVYRMRATITHSWLETGNIGNRSWILIIHKVRILRKNSLKTFLAFKNGVDLR